MAKRIGAELPQDLFAALTAGDLASKRNRAVQIVTVGRDGWPSTASLPVCRRSAAHSPSAQVARCSVFSSLATTSV